MFHVDSRSRAGERQEAEESSQPADVLIRLVADFGEDGLFGHRTLEVTREVVRVLEAGEAISFQMPIAEIQPARNEPLIGGGRMELIAKNGEVVPIIPSPLTLAAKFSEAGRGIEQLAKGEP